MEQIDYKSMNKMVNLYYYCYPYGYGTLVLSNFSMARGCMMHIYLVTKTRISKLCSKSYSHVNISELISIFFI